jgi:hypothetical protein
LVVRESTLKQAQDYLEVGLWIVALLLALQLDEMGVLRVQGRGFITGDCLSAHFVATRSRRRHAFVLFQG